MHLSILVAFAVASGIGFVSAVPTTTCCTGAKYTDDIAKACANGGTYGDGERIRFMFPEERKVKRKRAEKT
jgi:hypothetical protein